MGLLFDNIQLSELEKIDKSKMSLWDTNFRSLDLQTTTLATRPYNLPDTYVYSKILKKLTKILI